MPQDFNTSYLKYKICVSGAAETELCSEDTLELAKEVGREIVRQNGIVVTGATTGIPYFAAIGAKEEGGISLGISPAASEIAHVKSYKLPIDYYDLIIYTGFEYSGRNLLLIRSSDAVINVCGRIGTLNEFTIAFEDKKVIGLARSFCPNMYKINLQNLCWTLDHLETPDVHRITVPDSIKSHAKHALHRMLEIK